MHDVFVKRALTDPRLFQRMQELSAEISEATSHKVEVKVVGHNPPVFTVIVDGSHVDPWMPWEQTILFLQGLLTGFAFTQDGLTYADGVAWAAAQVQAALNKALSQDRDADTERTVDA